MAFNIADFRSIVASRGGIAEANKFRVRFYLPAGLQSTPQSEEANHTGADIETIRVSEYWAQSVNIPTIGFMTSQSLRYGYGALQNRPYAPQYVPVQVNFITDEHVDIWKLFANWTNMIFNTRMQEGINSALGQVNVHGAGNVITYAPYELSYQIEYITDLEIHTFTKTGELIQKIVLREAFPVSMGGVELDWADTNSYIRLPVTFAYTDAQFYYGDQIEI